MDEDTIAQIYGEYVYFTDVQCVNVCVCDRLCVALNLFLLDFRLLCVRYNTHNSNTIHTYTPMNAIGMGGIVFVRLVNICNKK